MFPARPLLAANAMHSHIVACRTHLNMMSTHSSRLATWNSVNMAMPTLS